jgi:hypothetical protein
MGFEKFTETARSYRAKVSIRSNGTIGLNGGAVNKFNLERFEWVILYFDKERKLIGIKPTASENEEGTHKINRGKTGAWIAARRFLDYYEAGITKTKRFDATWDDKEKMIIVQVS